MLWHMGAPTAIGSGNLFAGGPPLGLQFKLGLVTPDNLHVARRVLLFVGVAWAPLLVLAGVEGRLVGSGEGRAFLADLGVQARNLVAGPLLIAAEAAGIRVLSGIARRFVELLPVEGGERPRFVTQLLALRTLRDTRVAEFAVAFIAFGLSLAAIRALPLSSLPAWHRAAGDVDALSLAGWWHAVVSLPLLLMLLLGWLWRLFIWTRLLLLASRLPLNLVAVHPDKAAGLAFVGYSLRAFDLVGAAIAAIVAGTMANEVMHGGAALLGYKYTVGGLVVFVVVLFTAPLLVFSLKLIEVWRRGVRQYDELARVLGLKFEREWFDGVVPRSHDDMLERGDFSAATDLYQVVDRVHDLRIVPVDLMSIVMLVGATLLPFVPVVLIALPLDAVLGALLGLVR